MRTFVIALALAVLVPATAAAEEAQPLDLDSIDPSIRVPVATDGAPSFGAADAPVTIVEFSDFYCPYCRRANETLAALLRIYPGQVRVVYRHSLLSERASKAAELAIAAEERGKFWPVHDRLFAGPSPTSIDGLVALASEVGLDGRAIRAELESGKHAARLAVDTKMAKGLGVEGVPVFFVNGRPVPGAHPISVFVRIIEEELELAAKGDAKQSQPLAGAEEIFRRGVDPDKFVRVGVSEASKRRGAKEPLVTIVEFSDYSCGYCRKVHPDLVELANTYPDEVRVVYRHFPLGPLLKPVAEAAEAAAAQGKFWQFTDSIFADETPAHNTRAELLVHARAAGLDIDKFSRALNEHTYAREVAVDAADGAALGVTGTPTLFINGRPIVGAPESEDLRALVLDEIKAAKALMDSGVARSELYHALCDRKPALD